MKINWKLRLQNKTTLVALITQTIALVYLVLGIFGVVPGVSQDNLTNILGVAVDLLCMLGIVGDPTTKGVSDSIRAMGYEVPK